MSPRFTNTSSPRPTLVAGFALDSPTLTFPVAQASFAADRVLKILTAHSQTSTLTRCSSTMNQG